MEVCAMASQKERAEKWRTFMWTRFGIQLWQDTKPRLSALLIGLILVVFILALQIHYGVIRGEVRHRFLSVFWPYALLALSFIFYHLARTPWLISNEHLDAIAALKNKNEQRERELQETIRTLEDKPKRSAAEQYHYDRAKAFLVKRGPKFVAALQHLYTRGDLTYSSMGATMTTLWPKGMDRNEAIPIYDACATEGLVNIQEIPGIHPAKKIFIAPGVISVLSELLY
jgi:hypothetical protein